MLYRLVVISLAFTFSAENSIAGGPEDTPLNSGNLTTSPSPLLREASRIANEQNKSESFWINRALSKIIKLQIQIRDFEGANISIKAVSSPTDRRNHLLPLARELAAAGKRQKSLEILKEHGTNHGYRQDFINDSIQLRWIDYLLETSQFKKAYQATLELESKEKRPDGFRKIAVAYAKTGDKPKSKQFFELSLNAAESSHGHYLLYNISKNAEAQIKSGDHDAANNTVLKLLEVIEQNRGWSKFSALTKAAVLSSRLNKREQSESLFRQAMLARRDVNNLNQLNSLNVLATKRAQTGDI